MNYDLYKKLEKAGFPIKEKVLFEGSGTLDGNKHTVTVSEYFPTLEELIEACGEKFQVLALDGKEWSAGEMNWDGAVVYTKQHGVYARGKTPIEAVANLWLSLNPRE